jgi:DNA-binding transcriptional regulator GbsR (MarR family)
MEIKKAKSLLDDILDICAQFEDETLTEACSGIYNDIQAAKNLEVVIASARELMVFVNEAPWEDADLLDLKDEIEEIFNRLMEEYEDF